MYLRVTDFRFRLPKSSSEAKWRKDNLINQYKVLIECHNNNIDYSVDRTCNGGVKSHMGLLSYPDFNPDAKLGSTSKFRTRSNPEAAPRNTDGAASDSQT